MVPRLLNVLQTTEDPVEVKSEFERSISHVGPPNECKYLVGGFPNRYETGEAVNVGQREVEIKGAELN